MPSVTLDRKTLEKTIGKKLSTEELKEAITFLGTDLDKITDCEIHVEIFPNRPDLLSEQGLGRALSSYLNVETGLKKYKINSPKENMTVTVKKSAKNIRPYTACAIVKGLTFNDEKIKEIIQIQEKLHITYGRNRKKCAIGVYPLEEIALPITLEAKNPSEIKFQPLESNKELTGLQILSQHPAGRDYGFLLEGLDKFPIFVDANNEVLSMPPIINSNKTGRISEKTKDVFVECSGFDQKVLDTCLNMIVTSLADMGGDIYGMNLINEHSNWKEKISPNLDASTMDLDIFYVNKVLGLNLKQAEIKSYLERMGYGYELKTSTVKVPAYRGDVIHQTDLVQDIAIAYGFKKFEKVIPKCATVGSRDYIEMLKVKVCDILAGLNLYETNTYCLVGHEQASNKVLMSESKAKKELVHLANSVTEGYDVLRREIIPSLLQILRNNKNRDYPQGFFETGFTFKLDDAKETKIDEGRSLAFIYTDKDAGYTYARQVLDYLLSNLNLEYKIKTPSTYSKKTYLEGRYGEVIVEGKKLGYLGQLNPEVLSNFELEMPATGFEIDFLKLADLIEEKS